MFYLRSVIFKENSEGLKEVSDFVLFDSDNISLILEMDDLFVTDWLSDDEEEGYGSVVLSVSLTIRGF